MGEKLQGKYKYEYNSEEKILYKTYFGKIKLIDITISWDIAIKQNIIPKETIGIINDYSKAEFDFDSIDEHKKIPEYYHENLHAFGGLRFAIVTNSPRDIVVPILIQRYDENYETSPFATIDGAKQWIMRK